MSQDDPFGSADSDRTFLIPTPGGRAPRPQGATPGTAPAASADASTLESLSPGAALNPLVSAASPLLNIVAQLRATLQHPNPASLRETLAQGIAAFESRAKASGIASEKVIASRYVLCTLLDETAASTPWGGSGAWGNQSLLVMFHKETWGGEKFFQLLAKLAESPGTNRDLLELMYVCLALGFEGRYRVIENGRAQLEALRERLLQMIRSQRGEYERELSPHWKGVEQKRGRILNYLPMWVVGAVLGVLLLGTYLSLNLSLNRTSDPVFAAIQTIKVSTAAPKPQPAQPAQQTRAAPVKPRLAGFLEPDINAGHVAVKDQATSSIITIRGDGLFEPGGTTIAKSVHPLLGRIAEALNSVPGQVLITGHTDSQPIRTARFPSNWHLSQERADSVAQLLGATVRPANRIKAEGRADTEAVAPNDTPAERARNRRVEITLFVAKGGPEK